MIKITIIAPNGYKMWFNLSHEEFQAWGDEILRIRNVKSVSSTTFDFQKEGEGTDLSKT